MTSSVISKDTEKDVAVSPIIHDTTNENFVNQHQKLGD